MKKNILLLPISEITFSWCNTCPVHNVNDLNFEGKTVSGEIIVHKNIADEVVNIFADLYEIGYPIRKNMLMVKP